MITIKMKRLENADGITAPFYATEGSAGADVSAAIAGTRILQPGERTLIPTGFSMELPPGYELQIRPRSGLAFKQGVTVLNAPGTVDNDYRGEIKVLLCNFGKDPFEITRGMRVAQIVIAPIFQGIWKEVEGLSPTYSDRTEAGFGSTGMDNSGR